MSKDSSLQITTKGSLAPVASTSTKTGEIVDLANAEAIRVDIHVGAITTLDGTNKFTATFQTDSDSAGGTMANVDSGDYVNPTDNAGVAWDRILDADAVANTVYSFTVKNTAGLRYGRVLLTAASSPSAVLGATVLMTHLRHASPSV